MRRPLRGPTLVLVGLSVAGVAACGRDGKGRLPSTTDSAHSPAVEVALSSPSEGAELPVDVDDAPRHTDSERLRDWAMKLITSVPEWGARARLTARVRGQRLGLICDDEFEPTGCDRGAPRCRMSCGAIRICEGGGCAGGRWLDFDVDAAAGTLSVSDETPLGKLPYGAWRNRFRSETCSSGEPELAGLCELGQAFPLYQRGLGGLGYGAPTSPAKPLAPELRAVLERGDFRLLRAEGYGATGFLVFVVEGSRGLPAPGDGEAFREWGAELVRANGLAACEVVVQSAQREPQRFQFDRFVLDSPNGGVYVFTEGAFHPWLAW